MKRALILVALLGGCASPKAAWVRADKSTFDTVGQEWIRYVRADAKLTKAQKDRRESKLRSWQARIEAAK